MVPPWVPPIPDLPPIPPGQEPPVLPSPQQVIPLAPRGRFGGVRQDIGNFGKSGGSSSMRRAVGGYIRK
ncbi:MAG TPA: hypothetical protein VF493_07955, partial [Terriglobales bacterium]